MSDRSILADLRRKRLHIQHGGTLRPSDLDHACAGFEKACDRVDELEAMVRSQQALLDDIAAAAGFKTGEQYSAASLTARLKDGDR